MIPDTVTDIGYGAFNYCTSLTSVKLSNNLVTVGNCAFINTTKLKTITIPKSVKEIGKYAFGYVWTGYRLNPNFGIKCYENTAGEEFAKNNNIPCKVVHPYSDEWTVDVPATCTTAGSKSRHCTECDGKTDVTEIPALGHKYVKESVVKPTLKTQGYTVYKCSECNKKVKGNIVPALISIEDAKITGVKNTTYTGKQIKPEIKVVLGSTTLTAGKDYNVYYGQNIFGTGAVKVIGKGKYAGTVRKTFNIVPNKTAVKLKSEKSKITVGIKKVEKAKSYQIQYGTSKDVKHAKILTTSSLYKSFSAAPGKEYYVRARAVNGNYVGEWSYTVTITAKK